jgi:hypothetical protein
MYDNALTLAMEVWDIPSLVEYAHSHIASLDWDAAAMTTISRMEETFG